MTNEKLLHRLGDCASHYAGCKTVGEAMEIAVQAAERQDSCEIEQWTSSQIVTARNGGSYDAVFKFRNDSVLMRKYEWEKYEPVEITSEIETRLAALFSMPPMDFDAIRAEFEKRYAAAISAIPDGIQPKSPWGCNSTKATWEHAAYALREAIEATGAIREQKMRLAEALIEGAPGVDKMMEEVFAEPGAGEAIFTFVTRDRE